MLQYTRLLVRCRKFSSTCVPTNELAGTGDTEADPRDALMFQINELTGTGDTVANPRDTLIFPINELTGTGDIGANPRDELVF